MRVVRVPFGMALLILVFLIILAITGGNNEFTVNYEVLIPMIVLNALFIIVPLVLRSGRDYSD